MTRAKIEVTEPTEKKPTWSITAAFKKRHKKDDNQRPESLQGKAKRAVWRASGMKLDNSSNGDDLKFRSPKKILDTVVERAGGVRGVISAIENIVVVNPKTQDHPAYKKFKLAMGYYSIGTSVLSQLAGTILERKRKENYWNKVKRDHLGGDNVCLDDWYNPTVFRNQELNDVYLNSKHVTVLHKFCKVKNDFEDYDEKSPAYEVYQVIKLNNLDISIVIQSKENAKGVKVGRMWVGDEYWDDIDEMWPKIEQDISAAYMEQFDTYSNELHLGDDIESVKRKDMVSKEHFAVEFDKLTSEIRNCLETGSKRGYILPGPPGTGKTTITKSICNSLRDFPVIYVKANRFWDSGYIEKLEVAISNFSPCIVVLEDMDSLNLREKNAQTGALLTLIDNSKLKKPVVYLATVNDTKLLNYTITRPGRFDVVLDVREPKTVQEVKMVAVEGVKFINGIECDDPVAAAGWWNLAKMRGMTHAEIGEIYKAAHLSGNGVNKKSIAEAIKQYRGTQKNLKKYEIKDE